MMKAQQKKVSFDSVFSEENLTRALKIMARKKVMPGVDGMRADELEDYWARNRRAVLSEIEAGMYTPSPLRQFYMKKPGKSERRRISVCTVLDQMLQHCLRFEAERYYTPYFHPDSYGFIKGRNAGQALRRCLWYMNNGLEYTVDADIRKCFDSVKHRIVIKAFEPSVFDERVLGLIEKYLKNPGISGDTIRHNRVGLPQGSCLSPVLCNLVLNRFDWKMKNVGIAFVRYADDLVLFCRTRKEAEEAKRYAEDFLSEALSLRLNNEKTVVCPADEIVFLSHAFRRKNGCYELSLDKHTAEKMRINLSRHIFSRNMRIHDRLDRVGAFHRGWLNYYSGINEDEMETLISEVEEAESRLLNQRVIRCHSETMLPYHEILSSKGYVTFMDWYGVIKERGA